MTKKYIFILGPTCSGKTKITLKLFNIFQLEIISIDSTMTYKGLNIGSDKPNKNILKKIKHNLINNLNIKENFSIEKLKKIIKHILNNINQKKYIPTFTGGNLMYIWNIQKEYKKTLNISLIPQSKNLINNKIENRLNVMLKNGLIDELIKIKKKYKIINSLNSIKSIGYKETLSYIKNKIKIKDLVKKINNSTKNLCKNQEIWLKKWKKNIYFIETNEYKKNKIIKIIKKYIFKRKHYDLE